MPIKQVYFDEIAAGTKKAEYREIKETTAGRYLQAEAGALLYDTGLVSPDDPDLGYIDIYNGGKFPTCQSPTNTCRWLWVTPKNGIQCSSRLRTLPLRL